MKKLFLTSSFSDVAHYFEKFVGYNVKGKSVTFITTATVPEEYTGYIDDDKDAFEQLGVAIDEFDVRGKTLSEIERIFAKNDFIYVSGGNTFYLLQELKKSNADQLLAEQIENGKIYIGVSAGSMVLSPDISYVELIDDSSKAPDLTDFAGLGILPFSPLPHFKSEPFEQVIDAVLNRYQDQFSLLPISNTQVIELHGRDQQIVGPLSKEKVNPVVYFEIPVTDMERAMAFYEAVFSFEFERKELDGYDMAFFPLSKDKPGITGALAKGDIYHPSQNGCILYFNTDNIDDLLKKVQKLGKPVLYPKSINIDYAFAVAEIEDSEGNRIALRQTI